MTFYEEHIADLVKADPAVCAAQENVDNVAKRLDDARVALINTKSRVIADLLRKHEGP